MKTIVESIKEKNEKIKKKLKDRKLFNRIYVWEKDAVTEEVDVDKALAIIVSKVPKFFFSNIEGIYIGQFPELNKRSLNALFQDNAIYVSNSLMDTDDLVKNIVHEVAHAIKEQFNEFFEDNSDLEREFLIKRNQLKKILNLNRYVVAEQDFDNLEYDPRFDKFLYQEVGYPILHTLTSNLFVSPYGATSYEEYFANGFEHYYLNDFVAVKTISPKLFQLISVLENIE